MHRRLAFLHTSPVHVETFDSLATAIDSTIQVEHVVSEELLAEAQRVGSDDASLIKRIQAAMTGAAEGGARVVVCTCSTIGDAAEKTPTMGRFIAARIDRAMADRAVDLGPKILVVAAVESTLGPTTDLIQNSATQRHRTVEIKHLLVADAWQYFMRGDRGEYIRCIAATVVAAVPNADIIVLAQASMAPAAATLNEQLGIKVLSSPLLGVQVAIEQIQGKT